MEKYLNRSGESGVTDFEIGDDYIDVKFEGKSTIYTYNNYLNGKFHIDNMKELAVSGTGLCRYIVGNPSVRNNYKKK